jgi:hypothetical protein
MLTTQPEREREREREREKGGLLAGNNERERQNADNAALPVVKEAAELKVF